MQPQRQRQLNWAEYSSPNQSPNAEIAAARWQFILAVQRVFPRFLEELQKQVYAPYAVLAKSRKPYWEHGWTFATWQLQSDRDNRLSPILIGWAKAFNADETWILEGALSTLWLWHQDPTSRPDLNISGFRSYCGGGESDSGESDRGESDSLTKDKERRFLFEDPGWDPEFQKWPQYRKSLREQFEGKVAAYEKRIRKLVESRGATRTHGRFNEVNFDWFVLYQLAGMSTTKILRTCKNLQGDESTIMKGVKMAAKLLRWDRLR
jgi:hypothetical protein